MTRTSTTVKKIRKALATDTGEVINFNDLDIETIRALAEELAKADAPAKAVCTSAAYKDAKKALETVRKASSLQLSINRNCILRLNSGELDLWTQVRMGYPRGADFIPVMMQKRRQMTAKQAAIYDLERTLLNSVEGNAPKVLAHPEQLEIEFE
jgi:hypothetical protein